MIKLIVQEIIIEKCQNCVLTQTFRVCNTILTLLDNHFSNYQLNHLLPSVTHHQRLFSLSLKTSYQMNFMLLSSQENKSFVRVSFGSCSDENCVGNENEHDQRIWE